MSDIATVPSRIRLDTSRTITMSRRDLIRGLACGSVVAFAGCSENPELGRSQLILVSDGQLAQLAASSWNDLKRKERVSRDPRHNATLQRVGPRIAGSAGMSGQAWEYIVFDSEQINAFVLPGGKVGFYTGIMRLFDNDDQCSIVMGHETGHVVGRHAAERFSQSLLADVGVTAVGIALQQGDSKYSGEIAAILGLGVTFGVILPYSRRHESEADSLGLRYAHKAGYDAAQAIPFWEKMAAKAGPRQPEFMSTHPDPQTRITAMKAQLRTMGYSV
ncbi:MAG: M48 family metallopeptidase [Alphaproteobacteria bacterium]